MSNQPEAAKPTTQDPITQDLEVMPWLIPAGDDGLKIDCIMVAVMEGAEIRSISLHLAGKSPTT